MHVAVYTDLSGKKPHIQVGMDTVMATGSLGDVIVNTSMECKICGLDSSSRYNMFQSHR